MSKAVIASINYAGLCFEGLMLPNGSYAIGVSQAAEIFQFLNKNASRRFKSLLGKDFQFLTSASELNPKPVNILTLDQFSLVCLHLFKAGNPIAERFVFASVAEKLERVFDNAFGILVEERERESRFFARLQTKASFRPLTDALQDAGFTEAWQYGSFIKKFQDVLDIECGTRDMQPMQKLVVLATAQGTITQLIRCGFSPDDAINSWHEHLT